ncbi:hypothetical protein PRABACTJOHN_00546 [Parabacteroides johnsonii DSM 18315]|uniref:Uncharacterized protein n=1 Tax=Parabacteroides johnsonii DSM 18315 TaxID=537006 RepID=B7B6A2_9BACT|nr:hypothetical protein PRABACTJOHN_00546 [Parabacteroides johnsonii DSM 18315]
MSFTFYAMENVENGIAYFGTFTLNFTFIVPYLKKFYILL